MLIDAERQDSVLRLKLNNPPANVLSVALKESLQDELTKRGMVFNTTDAEFFRAALRKAGFYAEWKQKFGAEAWRLLESHVGALS